MLIGGRQGGEVTAELPGLGQARTGSSGPGGAAAPNDKFRVCLGIALILISVSWTPGGVSCVSRGSFP